MANTYRNLTADEIRQLELQGCSAVNWQQVQVAEPFNAVRVKGVHFAGEVKVGKLQGNVSTASGLEKISGLFNAYIADCTIGDNTRVANVGGHIANYDIGDEVCIEDVGVMQTNAGASFGNGVEVEVLNEAGGREVVLFNEMTAQYAYMMCLHRYRPGLIKKLHQLAADYTATVKSDRGTVAKGARICSVKEMVDVNIGEAAVVNGAACLENGTILSAVDAPARVGVGVIADDFIIAEGASVSDEAILGKVFVGQGCQIGKQYSAENSLFFANCEAFHGEACSIFAGPYTVTHHKSSLLIAGLFSFYNAGSGTNQSNHMYKLGPCHEGKLGRGTKTGSFSYMMWPCKTGPFSVVLGKHTGTFDTSDFPFSHLEARHDGKCAMVPGLYLTTVGTVRDGAKWPARDRRKGSVKRDIINFDVFCPYTVGKMLTATARLKQLQQETDKSVEEVSIGGALVRRPILRTGQKYYRTGIEMYLLEKVITRLESHLEDTGKIEGAFGIDAGAVVSEQWVDMAGQMMTAERMSELEDAVEAGKVNSVADLAAALAQVNEMYTADEWAWVKKHFAGVFGVELDAATKDDLIKWAKVLQKVKSKFLNLVIADASKEFDELSAYGFGQDGGEGASSEDFKQVRGVFEENKFVKSMQESVAQLQQRVEKLLAKLDTL